MARKTLDQRSELALWETIARYERRGYEVLEHPRSSQLPSFLRQYAPDIVAIGPHDNVVVEVKTSGTIGDRQLAKLTDLVDSRSDWRLELVMVDEEPMTSEASGNVADATTDAPRAKLSSSALRTRRLLARDLSAQGHDAEGLLLMWSVVEGALRLIARRRDIEFERQTPRGIAKQMTVLGYISKPDFRVLEDAAHVRNAVVHGRIPSDIPQSLVTRMDSLSHELIAQVAKTRKAPKGKASASARIRKGG